MFQDLLFLTRKTLQGGKNVLERIGRIFSMDNVAGSGLRRLALVGLCGLLFSVAFTCEIPHTFAAQAIATQAAPPYTESFYVTSNNTTTAYNHGCSQGHADAYWHSSSEVVLDFGGQVSTSAVDNFSVGTLSNGSVEAMAEAFAHGYWSCTGSDSTTILRLGIGTNNSISGATNSSTGNAWAHVAATVQAYDVSHSYASQVVAFGANDLETWCNSSGGGCQTASGAINWANGFSSAGTGRYYIDYGSADGCPTNASNNAGCSGGWNQYDYWYVSWGAAPAHATPEIYNDTMAWQWQKISLYGYLYQGGQRIDFDGPMATSAYISTGTCWSDFSGALNSDSRTAVNMPYLTTIEWAW